MYNALNEAARRALEAMMLKSYDYKSDIAQRFIAEGRDKGRAEGRTEEAARAVLTVLRARGVEVPEAARDRVLAERDVARLERWLERAALAAKIAEVFEEPS